MARGKSLRLRFTLFDTYQTRRAQGGKLGKARQWPRIGCNGHKKARAGRARAWQGETGLTLRATHETMRNATGIRDAIPSSDRNRAEIATCRTMLQNDRKEVRQFVHVVKAQGAKEGKISGTIHMGCLD